MTYSYLGVPIGFYNPISKQIEVVALACKYMPHPHTAVCIREELKKIFKSWGFDEKKVVRFITDRGANIICTLSPFQIQQTIPIVASLDDQDLAEEGSNNEDSDSENDSENDINEFSDAESEDEVGDEDAAYTELVVRYLQYLEEETEYQQSFPKRLSCVAHVLQLMCNTIKYKKDSPIQKLKHTVLKLVNRFSKSGVANQNLKVLGKKKLLKVAKTRWNSLYYVAKRLLELKPNIVSVCNKRDWSINFTWSALALCVDFFEANRNGHNLS